MASTLLASGSARLSRHAAVREYPVDPGQREQRSLREPEQLLLPRPGEDAPHGEGCLAARRGREGNTDAILMARSRRENTSPFPVFASAISRATNAMPGLRGFLIRSARAVYPSKCRTSTRTAWPEGPSAVPGLPPRPPL